MPAVPGGGTIVFVSPSGHSYHPDPEIREEGGTPAIVESIRAGLVFALKEAVGADEIRRREDDFVRRALDVLGQRTRTSRSSATRSSSGSRSSRSACAHPRGAAALATSSSRVLNDLFGIQARERLLLRRAVHPPHVPDRRRVVGAAWSGEVARGHMGAKLAFVRVSFNYFISEAVFDYIVEAVHLLADEGWKLLPLYRFDPVHAGSGTTRAADRGRR